MRWVNVIRGAEGDLQDRPQRDHEVAGVGTEAAPLRAPRAVPCTLCSYLGHPVGSPSGASLAAVLHTGSALSPSQNSSSSSLWRLRQKARYLTCVRPNHQLPWGIILGCLSGFQLGHASLDRGRQCPQQCQATPNHAPCVPPGLQNSAHEFLCAQSGWRLWISCPP